MKSFKSFLLENFSLDNNIDYDKVFNQWYEEHGNTPGVIDEIIDDYLEQYPNPKYGDGVLNQIEFDQIGKTKKFRAYIKYEYFKNKYEEFKKIIEPILNSKQKIPIYRQITILDFFNTIDDIKKNIEPELGIYWTWDYNSAKSYWGDETHKNIINIVSEIDETSIDWNETLLANMINPDEKELTLKSNYPLHIIELHDMSKNGEKINIGTLPKQTFTT